MRFFSRIFSTKHNKEILKMECIIDQLHFASSTDKDIDDYHNELYSDPLVMEKFGNGEVRKEEDSRKIVKSWVERWEENIPFSSIVVRDKSTNEFKGHVILNYGEGSVAKEGEAELAYAFSYESWGKKIGQKSVSFVVDNYAPVLVDRKYKVNSHPFTTIVATVRPDNGASISILDKVSMKNTHHNQQKPGGLRMVYAKDVAPQR